MGYKFKYYKPFKKQLARLRLLRTARNVRRVIAVLLAAVLLPSLMITVSEYAGGPLPTWDEIYEACGLVRLPHLPQEARDAASVLHFIDVGQADATLIQQDGEYCLIDTGEESDAAALLRYLNAIGVTRLRLLVLTHGHKDHIGGACTVLEQIPTQAVLLPDFTKEDARVYGYTLARVLQQIDSLGVQRHTAREGDAYAVGTGTLTVLGTGLASAEEENNRSIVTRFTARGITFLSCGDAQREELSDMIERGVSLRARVYKASHHGAANAASEQILKAIKPDYVIVSCGADNSFGHPHQSALRAFAKVNATVYRTDINSSVVVYVDARGRLQAAPMLPEAELEAA